MSGNRGRSWSTGRRLFEVLGVLVLVCWVEPAHACINALVDANFSYIATAKFWWLVAALLTGVGLVADVVRAGSMTWLQRVGFVVGMGFVFSAAAYVDFRTHPYGILQIPVRMSFEHVMAWWWYWGVMTTALVMYIYERGRDVNPSWKGWMKRAGAFALVITVSTGIAYADYSKQNPDKYDREPSDKTVTF